MQTGSFATGQADPHTAYARPGQFSTGQHKPNLVFVGRGNFASYPGPLPTGHFGLHDQ